MRERSSSVDSLDPLVSFLYILIRDHLPCGVIEDIMLQHVETKDTNTAMFSNGWLAQYAIDVASQGRLKGTVIPNPPPLLSLTRRLVSSGPKSVFVARAKHTARSLLLNDA